MLIKFYSSTIGKKVVVALTGIVLLLFVIGHMAGNLKAFGGYDDKGVHKLDSYAIFLRDFASDVLGHSGFLWTMRAVLLVCLLVHVFTVIQLQRINSSGRGSRYAVVNPSSATVASRTMFIGGLVLLAYTVYHILHMTVGVVHFGGFVEGRVYANVYRAFTLSYVTFIYVAAMGFLGLHTYHGVWSLFQTLGLNTPDRHFVFINLARLLAVVLFFGFISVPLAVYFNLLPPPNVAAGVAG